MDFELLTKPLFNEGVMQEYRFTIKYSEKFNNYNANVKFYRLQKHVEFHLSRKWQSVSEEIRIGLLQSLLVRLFKKSNTLLQTTTFEIQLYDLFLKNLHTVAVRKESDVLLISIFNELNEKFFFNVMEMPNLVWGNDNLRKVGTYEYATDTVTISSALVQAPNVLIAYVVYHELLHKKHKFTMKNGKSYHHTPAFKNDEALFEDYQQVEKMLKKYLSSKKSTFLGFHF